MEHWLPSIRLNVLRAQMIVNQFVHQTCEHQGRGEIPIWNNSFSHQCNNKPLSKKGTMNADRKFIVLMYVMVSFFISTMHLSVCPKILWTRLHKRKHFEEEFYFDFRFNLQRKFGLKLNFIMAFFMCSMVLGGVALVLYTQLILDSK